MMILAADTSKVAEETVETINHFENFIQKNGPLMIQFGLKVILALVVFFIGHKIIKWVRKLVRASMQRANSDTGACQFVDSLLKFSLHILLIIVIANKLGVESTSTAALIASGGVGISLALQGSLSNLAGGMLILLLKPFVVGDYIVEDAHGNEGTVKEIQIFYTKLATVDNKTIIIPNGTLANTSMTNVTAKDFRQLDLKIDISYEASLPEAKRILLDILLQEPSVLQEMEHHVFVDNLGESSVVLGARAWVKTEEFWPAKWRMLERIKLTFDETGIEIPYKQVRVHVNGQTNSVETL